MNKTDSLKYIDYDFIQNEERYKVNTDTVCLGMFLDPLIGKSVLDIGTNTGALLLYAHKKGAKELHGVEIHEDALKLADENLKKYTDQYYLYHQKVQDLEIDPVDAIVCNPPFFEMNNVTEDTTPQQAPEEPPENTIFDKGDDAL